MVSKILLFFGTIFLVVTSHIGGVEKVEVNRKIHFFGDSISRGWGFGTFEHSSFINSIQGIVNTIAKENGWHSDVLRSEIGQNYESVWHQKREKKIEPGDIILFEDAGHHYNNVDAYRNLVELFIFAVHYTPPSQKMEDFQVILTTTADYKPPKAYYNSEYDTPINGEGETINDVFRQLSRKKGVELLDWNRMMDEAVIMMKKYGFSPMHNDGVHPNIFGNFLYAISIVHKLGLDVEKYDGVLKEFLKYRGNYRRIFRFSLSENQVKEALKDLVSIVKGF